MKHISDLDLLLNGGRVLTAPGGIFGKGRGVTGEPRVDSEVVPVIHLSATQAIVDCVTVGCCNMVKLGYE